MSPALPPTCSSASLMPLTIAVVCGRCAPCSGSEEYTVTDEAFPSLPLSLEEPPLSSPHPPPSRRAAAAAANQPVVLIAPACPCPPEPSRQQLRWPYRKIR